MRSDRVGRSRVLLPAPERFDNWNVHIVQDKPLNLLLSISLSELVFSTTLYTILLPF